MLPRPVGHGRSEVARLAASQIAFVRLQRPLTTAESFEAWMRARPPLWAVLGIEGVVYFGSNDGAFGGYSGADSRQKRYGMHGVLWCTGTSDIEASRLDTTEGDSFAACLLEEPEGSAHVFGQCSTFVSDELLESASESLHPWRASRD
jgi:hypothetical protein